MFVITFSVMLVTAKKSRWISHDAMRSDIYLTKDNVRLELENYTHISMKSYVILLNHLHRTKAI